MTAAQRTASWCNSQPWQVVIASGEAKERFRKSIYAEAASGAGDGHDFPPPREYLGVYLDRRRESGFQLYNSLGIARGDKAAYARQALENYQFLRRAACRHHSYRPRRSGSTARSIAAAMSAISCWRRRRSVSAALPQAALARHSRLVRHHFNLGDDRRVVCGISFGFPDRAHKANSYRTTRAGIADTVTFVDE